MSKKLFTTLIYLFHNSENLIFIILENLFLNGYNTHLSYACGNIYESFVGEGESFFNRTNKMIHLILETVWFSAKFPFQKLIELQKFNGRAINSIKQRWIRCRKVEGYKRINECAWLHKIHIFCVLFYWFLLLNVSINCCDLRKNRERKIWQKHNSSFFVFRVKFPQKVTLR